MTLGQRIQELRKQAGLSQEGLGEALGVSRQAVSKWEGDNGVPELDTLIAMSRLFRIPLGQLLGVEEPAGEEESPAPGGISEEQLEAILRRYSEESRRPEEPEEPQKLPAGSWILAGCAVVLAVVVLAVGIGKLRGTMNTIRDLQSQISALQSGLSSVSGQVNDISGDLRQQVEQALEEGNRLISTFGYEVVDFDAEAQTVTVRFEATLKEYTAGSRLQFLLDWKHVDGTEGRTLSEEAEGPDFKAVVTLPMNDQLDVTARVKGGDGSLQEQWVDVIYSGMRPEVFELNLYGGLGASHVFSVTKWTLWGQHTSTSAQGNTDLNSVRIYSYDADFLWPVTGHYVVNYRGETVLEQDVEFRKVEGDGNLFRAEVEQKHFKMEEDDEVIITLTMIDNLGRVKEFRQEFRVRNGEIDWPPNEAIVIWPD